MSKPVRIQRKRTKGWKMPPNTVYVGRPTRWGNHFVVTEDPSALAHYGSFRNNVDLWTNWPVADAATAVQAFRKMSCSRKWFVREVIGDLRGKNLACWCALDQPCHADVLLELANKDQP